MSLEGTSANPTEEWSQPAALPEVEWDAAGTEGSDAPSTAAGDDPTESPESSSASGADPCQEELPFAEEPVALVDSTGLSALGEAASARGYLWIALPKPGPAHRGRLGLFIEQTIEQELEDRGALPPGIVSSTGLDASLSDQLYRARLIEKRGLALGLPSLEGITNLGRTLDADDSSVLRWWMAATADRPVRLLIDRDNTRLRVYPSPVFFDSLFDVAPAPVSPRPAGVQMAESSEAMGLSDLPPAVQEHETNVLGTEVATMEGASALEVPDDDATSAYESEDHEHVDLPDLDRALGLSVEPQISTEVTDEHGGPESARQLSLGYSEPVAEEPAAEELGAAAHAPSPRIPTLIATVAPPSEDVDELTSESAESFSEQDEEVTASGAARDLGAIDEPSGPAALEPEDELDAEDFLQTLAEDSARAPRAEWQEEATDVDELPSALAEDVAAEPALHDAEPALHDAEPALHDAEPALHDAEPALHDVEPALHDAADDLVAPIAEPSPLPTKAIRRNPFIRLATVEDEEPEATASEPEMREEPVIAAEAQALAVEEPASAPDPEDPFNQLASREWKSWVSNLEAARGPKPLSVIERMFVTDYTRLREAVRRGVADPGASGILDEWRDSFTQSYSEAFDALRVRGKRPTMVLDLPELAARLGRLQGAKRVQLLLVDGLRFDLGLMVQDRMRKSAAAALTERLLLWSALPTVTSVQLELLGKGADGLKDELAAEETPALVARGRAATTPRRVRTGALELFKLDVVEDSLREAGPPVVQRLDRIADRTAAALVDHLGKQPARTMVVIFGDHGFALDPRAAGTTEEVRQGGASPEEVLVPAFAWLTGAVH